MRVDVEAEAVILVPESDAERLLLKRLHEALGGDKPNQFISNSELGENGELLIFSL